jgi:hypothetical protein
MVTLVNGSPIRSGRLDPPQNVLGGRLRVVRQGGDLLIGEPLRERTTRRKRAAVRLAEVDVPLIVFDAVLKRHRRLPPLR